MIRTEVFRKFIPGFHLSFVIMTHINRLLRASQITNAKLENNAAATEHSVQRPAGQSWPKLLAEALVVLAVPYLASAVNVPRRSPWPTSVIGASPDGNRKARG